MTNNTETLTITRDDDTYTITLPTDDRAILRLMIELQRDAAAELLRAATRDLDPINPYHIDSDSPMTQFDYSGDHDDYNAAAANLLSDITHALVAHTTETAREALIELMTDESTDFLIDTDTADFNSPLLDLIHNPIFD